MGRVVITAVLAAGMFVVTGCNQMSLEKSTSSFTKQIADDTKESAKNSAKSKINEATSKAFKF